MALAALIRPLPASLGYFTVLSWKYFRCSTAAPILIYDFAGSEKLAEEGTQMSFKLRDLGWTDEYGRRWNKPSDILTNKELQNPIPPTQRKRECECEKRVAQSAAIITTMPAPISRTSVHDIAVDSLGDRPRFFASLSVIGR
jgi:hypothetical protein